MTMRLVRCGVAVVLVLLGGLGFASAPAGAADGNTVLRARVDGVITPVIADHVVDGVARAEREGHAAFLVEMDTPGGLDHSMRQIVQSFLDAEVPVVVYVHPSGARAASAGAIITFAAHVAVMGPATTIGAATPVDAQTGETAGDKVVNDAVAYAAAVAGERGRDTDFAMAAVREGRSVTASEAERIGAVDLVATDRAELMSAVDGRSVAVADGRSVILRMADARVVDHEFGLFKKLLQILADPNVAFLLLSIGTLALIYEFATPGVGLGGAIGAIMLVLAFFALSVLPVAVAGLLLLALAAGFFLAEVFAPGVGVFAGGGAIALLFAGLFLFEGDDLRVDPVVLLPTVVVIAVGVVFAGRLAWRARRGRPTGGTEAFAGREVVVREASGVTGRVMFEGAWWTVRSLGDRLRAGQPVRVVGLEELTLLVEPVDGSASKINDER